MTILATTGICFFFARPSIGGRVGKSPRRQRRREDNGEKLVYLMECSTFDICSLFLCDAVSVGIVGENPIKKATPKSG